MKKILAFVLTLCLLCGTVALAETTPITGNEATTELTVVLAESYEVIIPATLDINTTATTTNLPIQVTSLRLLPKGTVDNTIRALQVYIDKDGSYQLANTADQTATIGYTLTGGEGTFNRYHYFTTVSTKNYIVTLNQDDLVKAPAGTYTDTVTFKLGIINKSINN